MARQLEKCEPASDVQQSIAQPYGLGLAGARRQGRAVVLAPVHDQDAGFGQAGEQLDRDHLIADAPAEALNVGVLPR